MGGGRQRQAAELVVEGTASGEVHLLIGPGGPESAIERILALGQAWDMACSIFESGVIDDR